MCCRLIALRWGPEELAERGERARVLAEDPDLTEEQRANERDNLATLAFIAAHWHEVSEAEALALLPEMVDDWCGAYYTCDQFDGERSLCMAHDTRPPICSGFPWYGAEPGTKGMINRALRRCGYWADVPRERWPVTVVPMRRVNGQLVPL
jgi:Fe-S-cluster containining protein